MIDFKSIKLKIFSMFMMSYFQKHFRCIYIRTAECDSRESCHYDVFSFHPRTLVSDTFRGSQFSAIEFHGEWKREKQTINNMSPRTITINIQWFVIEEIQYIRIWVEFITVINNCFNIRNHFFFSFPFCTIQFNHKTMKSTSNNQCRKSSNLHNDWINIWIIWLASFAIPVIQISNSFNLANGKCLLTDFLP